MKLVQGLELGPRKIFSRLDQPRFPCDYTVSWLGSSAIRLY